MSIVCIWINVFFPNVYPVCWDLVTKPWLSSVILHSSNFCCVLNLQRTACGWIIMFQINPTCTCFPYFELNLSTSDLNKEASLFNSDNMLVLIHVLPKQLEWNSRLFCEDKRPKIFCNGKFAYSHNFVLLTPLLLLKLNFV